MPAAFTAGLSTAAKPICSGFYAVATMVQPGKRTQRRQAQTVSWAREELSHAAEPSHRIAAPLSNQARTMPAASTAGLSTAAGPICSGFYPAATLAQRGKHTQRRQAQAVSWAVRRSSAEPSHRIAAPLSKQAITMPAASTASLSTAARPICSVFYPVASLSHRGKRTQRRQAQAVPWAVRSCAVRPLAAACLCMRLPRCANVAT